MCRVRFGMLAGIACCAGGLLAEVNVHNGIASVLDKDDPTNGGFWNASGYPGTTNQVRGVTMATPLETRFAGAGPILSSDGFGFETAFRYTRESPAIALNTKSPSGMMIYIR